AGGGPVPARGGRRRDPVRRQFHGPGRGPPRAGRPRAGGAPGGTRPARPPLPRPPGRPGDRHRPAPLRRGRRGDAPQGGAGRPAGRDPSRVGRAGAVGARGRELHLAVQHALLAGAVSPGGGGAPGGRARASRGGEYEQALPGGQSDARNTAAAAEMIGQLFAVWDGLDARHALPPELYIVELGVGNGSQARTWLDTFADLDRRHGREYYRRLHYLMGDSSAHVLDRARLAVAHHGDRVNGLVLDATSPLLTLGFLRGKAFCVYISNVYDNLPTDELASIGGRPYLVEVRAYLGDEEAGKITARHRLPDGALGGLTERLLRLGPDLLAETSPETFAVAGRVVAFWRDVWAALRLQERYVPLEGLDAYQVSPSLTGEILRPLLGSSGDIRMHASNGALASFEGTLPLLHPFGRLLCHDLFLPEPTQYLAGFYGPGKYDGSVVNWVNGPLLQLIGNRRGFDVQIAPFAARPGSNVRTLTAQVRD